MNLIQYYRTAHKLVIVYTFVVNICFIILPSSAQAQPQLQEQPSWGLGFAIPISNTATHSSTPNHNLKNKTTISVVGLRLSNHWKTTHHRNSKLHDRAKLEQNSENKSYQSTLGDPKTVFESYPNPKNGPLGPQKVKNDPKIKSKSNVRI